MCICIQVWIHAVYFKISLISETLGFIFSHFINSKTCLTRERRHFQTVKKKYSINNVESSIVDCDWMKWCVSANVIEFNTLISALTMTSAGAVAYLSQQTHPSYLIFICNFELCYLLFYPLCIFFSNSLHNISQSLYSCVSV